MINSKNTDLIILTIDEHIKLLNRLGYEINTPLEDIPNYSYVGIYYKDKEIGKLSYEEKNMFYLYRDKRIVGNRDLSKIKFNKRKEKNVRSMVHININHRGLHINCFNQLINDDRNYIRISDGENIIITKLLDNDEIKVESLLSSINYNEILGILQMPYNKKLTYHMNGVN